MSDSLLRIYLVWEAPARWAIARRLMAGEITVGQAVAEMAALIARRPVAA